MLTKKVGNLDKFNLFIENVKNGVKDKIRITSYTKEGDPIFYNLDDSSQDSYGGSETRTATCSDYIHLSYYFQKRRLGLIQESEQD